MKNLNKENFFNEAMAKYPNAVQKFCDWIDEYKVRNNWNQLFNHGAIGRTGEASAPKFHDIPIEMQLGIMYNFFSENGVFLYLDYAYRNGVDKHMDYLFSIVEKRLNEPV